MSYGEDYFKAQMQESTSYYAKDLLERMYPKETPIVVPVEIGENDVILGFKTEYFTKDNVQTVNLGLFARGETSNVNTAFLGQTGSGKTAEAYKRAENYIFRFRNCFFAVDPKGEAWIHKEALHSLPDLHAVDKCLGELGQKRQGMDLLIISPRGIIEDKNIDFYFSVGWEQIKMIARWDQSEATKILAGIIGISQNDDDCIDILDRALEDDDITTLKQFLNYIKEINDKESLYYAGSSKVLRKLKLRMDKGLLSDDPKYRLDLLYEMKKRQGVGGVIFRGKLKVAGLGNYVDSSYESCLQLCLSLILYDGIAWNIAKDSRAILQSDVLIHIGELDTLAPDDNRVPMSLYLRSLATKGRQAGINLSVDIQEISTVDSEMMAQFRIFDCGPVSEANAKALEKKGIGSVNIGYLKKLRQDVYPVIDGRKMKWKLTERVVIGKNNEIRIYVGSPSQSQFMWKR